MHDFVTLVALVVGLPVLGGSLIAITAILRSWALKSRELALKEHQVSLEEKLRTDEMNAKILRMDDYGVSPAELNQLAEQVRQLREEVAKIKQDQTERLG